MTKLSKRANGCSLIALAFFSLARCSTSVQFAQKSEIPSPAEAHAVKFASGSLTFLSSEDAKVTSLYFVIDVTGSMATPIIDIRENIQQMVDTLAARGIELRVGGVAFRDEIVATQALTTNITTFKNFLNGLSATGGVDENEAHLLALQTAVTRIDQEDTSTNSVKAIFSFTDNPGHNGGSSTSTVRDCSLSSTISAFQSRPDYFGPLSWFFSVQSNGGTPCGGYSNARAQSDSLMSQLKNASILTSESSALAWPLNDEILSTDFVNKLIEIQAAEKKLCLPKSAYLSIGSTKISEWQASDLQAVLEQWEANQSLEWSGALPTEHTASLEAGKVELWVNQCCLTWHDGASTPPASTCQADPSYVRYEFQTN